MLEDAAMRPKMTTLPDKVFDLKAEMRPTTRALGPFCSGHPRSDSNRNLEPETRVWPYGLWNGREITGPIEL